MKSSGKNFIIAFLMILAIYQTAELWFEDFSSHNFFSFADKATINKVRSEKPEGILKGIIINKGDNRLVYKANGIGEEPYKKAADALIARILKKGQLVKEGSVDWKPILESKCLVYQYDVSLGGGYTSDIFGVQGGMSSKIKTFDTLALSYTGGNGRLRFINSGTNWCMEIGVEDNGISSEVNNLFNTINVTSGELYYISSVQNGFEIFHYNEFIPRWDGQATSLNGVTALSQYQGQEGKNLLESHVNVFFNNPAGKWTTTVNGIINYSDESRVVKYYPTGVLEYSDYSTEVYEEPNSFYNNYTSAIAMIKRDIGVENEVYLKSYKTVGSRFVMEFGYKINDLPVEISEGLKKETGMDSFIEVYAEKGRVTRYKRCCQVYFKQVGYVTLSKDFLNAVDMVYADLEDESGATVDKLELVYMDEGNEDTVLKWLITVNGEEYVLEA